MMIKMAVNTWVPSLDCSLGQCRPLWPIRTKEGEEKNQPGLDRFSETQDQAKAEQLTDIFTSSPHTAFSFRKIINLFKVLGQFVSKAMLDSRNIDIPFNPIFLAKILDPTYATDITTMMVRHRIPSTKHFMKFFAHRLIFSASFFLCYYFCTGN